jgi:hypothetical protein
MRQSLPSKPEQPAFRELLEVQHRAVLAQSHLRLLAKLLLVASERSEAVLDNGDHDSLSELLLLIASSLDESRGVAA